MKRNSIWILIMVFGFAICVPGEVLWAAGEDITVVGVLEGSESTTYLTTENAKYVVVGQNLSNLIGKRVKVTGSVSENYRGKSLLVKDVEIVPD